MKYVQALVLFVSASAFCQSNNVDLPDTDAPPDTSSVQILEELAEEYFRKAEYPRSLNHRLELLEVLEVNSDSLEVPRQLFEIGRIHYFIRNENSNKEALEYINAARLLAQEYDDSIVLYKTHRGIGAILGENYLNHGSLSMDTAIYHLELSKTIADSQRDYMASSGILSVIGAYLLSNGTFPAKVGSYFEQALQTARKSKDSSTIAFALQKLGEFHLEQQSYDSSLLHFDESLAIYYDIDDKNGILNSLFRKAKLLTAHGSRDELSEVWDLYYLYRDSVYNENTTSAFAEMQVKFETEKKEQEIQVLTAEAALADLQLQQTRSSVFYISILSILLVAGVILFSSRKRYKLRAHLALEKQEIQQERFRSFIEGQEKERKRIAGELHDGLGQLLSSTKLILSSVEHTNTTVDKSLQMVDKAVDEVRTISHNLMPNALATHGFSVAIKDMIEALQSSDKMEVSLHSDDLSVEESIAANLYRAVQEVVNNALKYSQASKLDIAIEQHEGILQINIQDNGIGFDTSRIGEFGGIGWQNIYSRIEVLGGVVNLISKLGEGTKVVISVPNATTNQVAAG